VKAFACLDGVTESFPVEAIFRKIPSNRKIILNTKYSPQYTAGGDMALIDYERGSDNFRTGAWQGYEGVNLDAVVDLGEDQQIHTVSVGFLQDEASWIFFPEQVTFSLSADGKVFREIGSIRNDFPDTREGGILYDFSMALQDEHARFVKVIAKNRGICPSWHPGAGSPAWIFADEITIE
jgi:hypothetical protein